MIRKILIGLAVAFIVALVALLAWRLVEVLWPAEETAEAERAPIPVEVATIERRPIELRQIFSGSLESPARFEVAAKIAGRIDSLVVHVADPIDRGAVVAQLDDDELRQELRQAQAELAVADANLQQARSTALLAQRALERRTTLRDRGISSDADFDSAQAEQSAAESAVAVAEAERQQAESAVESAQIRLGFTQVRAGWNQGDQQRVVAERFLQEGDTVSAGDPIVSIVELDPLLAVFFVAERDYGRLAQGQSVTLQTDAYPGRTFEGEIVRVAPIFTPTSRQARVEAEIANVDRLLKPGMFVRVSAVLDRAEQATVVPESAITSRSDQTAVFLLDEAADVVRLQPVQTGISQDGFTEILGDAITGKVVTLGQQLLNDGSPVRVIESSAVAESGR